MKFGPVALALFAELECANLFENANYANWNVATCKHEVARSLPLCILPLANSMKRVALITLLCKSKLQFLSFRSSDVS